MTLKKVIFEKRTYSRAFASHQHDYGQFLFPLQGSMELQTEKQHLHLKTDHCFYLPPGCLHTFRSIDRNEFLVLDMPMRYVSRRENGLYFQVNQQWAAIRFLLLEEIHHSDGSTAALNDLTRYVSQKLQHSRHPSIEYIHNHYHQHMKVSELAKLEHYHPIYFSSWFKQMTGKSPKAYISAVRLDVAKRLLRDTDLSIAHISQEVGFNHPSSFTKWFVRSEGISPQMYRKSFI